MTMDYLGYLPKFRVMINRKYPNINERTIEVYLDAFAVLPPPLEIPEKTSIAFEIFRARGNHNFVRGKYRDAAISYTVSLMHAPPNSESAAIAMANRSAALYHLKLYKECVTDIDRALQLQYPTHSRGKLILRKEAAVAKLNDDSSMTNKKSNAKVDNDHHSDLKCAHGDNANLPGASDGINIKCDSQGERKLIAEKAFKACEIILMEKPYLIVPEFNENPTFCYHCLKETLCLISCDRCNKQIYCSEKCRSEAFLIYHHTECPILNTLVAGNLIDLKTRVRQLRCLIIFTEQGMDFDEKSWFKRTESNSSDPARLGFTGEQFVGNTRQAFLSLPVGDASQKQGMLFEAAYLVTLLKNHTDFFKNDIDIPVAAEMLIKLNMIYASNHFAVPYIGQLREKASAVFPLVSLATHACISNTVAYCDADGKFILRASDYIKPGDEILYNYRELIFEFEVKKHGKSLLCKRGCKKCQRTCLHTINEKTRIEIEDGLREKLLENPYDVEALWKLKMFLYGQGERYRLQVQGIKLILADAYGGIDDLEQGRELLRKLGIL